MGEYLKNGLRRDLELLEDKARELSNYYGKKIEWGAERLKTGKWEGYFWYEVELLKKRDKKIEGPFRFTKTNVVVGKDILEVCRVAAHKIRLERSRMLAKNMEEGERKDYRFHGEIFQPRGSSKKTNEETAAEHLENQGIVSDSLRFYSPDFSLEYTDEFGHHIFQKGSGWIVLGSQTGRIPSMGMHSDNGTHNTPAG